MISVIIPVYNCQAFICDALDSVRSQSAAVGEIILVDDCSTDDSPRVIEDYQKRSDDSRIRLVRQPCNAGVSAARNLGAARATGEWLAFLDGDDVWLPDHLRTCRRLCGSSQSTLAVEAAEARNEDLSRLLYWHGPSPRDARNFRASLWIWNYFLPSTMFMHRNLFSRLGGFDTRPEFNHAEDWDFLLRLITTDISIAYSGEVGCKWRKHPAAATRNHLAMMERGLRILEHHRSEAPPRLWRKSHRHYRWQAGLCLLRQGDRNALRYHMETVSIHPLSPRAWAWLFRALASSLRRRLAGHPGPT